ncbi:MAG: LLM class flavin-dependent oxidoreductase [Alphaproteobacteria bacterium]|jgi:alkanesulfonate monooxygenase SsuD/methylene tetrahydromethanopterin reductase-like flavin-dependent oxidoreductase (luciferase family)|nr:LLM class flavin-dependent oxidoreductase [Alphaproteobacteria bacterium]|tara:strand:+ start:38 stop:1123 length:1086 start_codon:yes stop_codon:yes gene_type:complete
MSTFFQNLTENRSDAEVYRHELSMADLAEPLGFDSIWAAEHHFDGYTMCPDVLQFLTYMAGRTSRVNLGSMVVVLPWHDPVRVAEQVAVLDQLSGGRTLLGLGRGLGRIEFEGFQVDMNESRERFVEYAEAILGGLESGSIEYQGRHYQQPKIAIRPAPLLSFRGRVYAAAVSPESARIMARLGIGIMIIAQKPWDKALAELENYREIYREINNTEPPRPIIVSFIACHESEAAANEMHERYIRRYSRSALDHYEFHNAGLANIKGYEYYGALAKTIEKHGIDGFVNFLADLQIYGTPDQVCEKILWHQEMVGSCAVIGVFSYGGMPEDEAKRNMTLFAEQVLPRLKAHEAGTAPGAVTAE